MKIVSVFALTEKREIEGVIRRKIYFKINQVSP